MANEKVQPTKYKTQASSGSMEPPKTDKPDSGDWSTPVTVEGRRGSEEE